MYTQKLIEHFSNPHNYGSIKDPDGTGQVGNPTCGDVMKLYIKLNKDVIEDIKFETFGCAAAIATSSVLTDIAKGKTIEEALAIKNQDIVNSLGGVPNVKIHCSILAVDALYEAIYDYLSKNKKEIPEKVQKRHEQLKKS